jgi:hypothetical protein
MRPDWTKCLRSQDFHRQIASNLRYFALGAACVR